MILTLDVPFDLGQIVYLVTDKDQAPCIITGFKLNIGGQILVIVQRSITETVHFVCELSATKDILLETTN